MIKRALVVSILVVCVVLAINGCAPGQSGFSAVGSSILGSTGFVSGSQADAIFEAGGKVVKAAEGFTDEQEHYLGRGVSANIFSKYPAYKNPSVNQYVNKVGTTVASFSDRPETFGGYHFMVLNSQEINAMAAPGGFVFVTKGFLKQMTNEDMLAAVLAHEIGHVVLGHGVKAISQSNLSDALLILGREAAASQGGAGVQALTSAFGDSVTDVANTILTKGYSRSQEYDADRFAADLLKKAGYNPSAMMAMLKVLESLEESSDSGWFSTHPEPDDRLDELEDVVSEDVVTPGEAVRAERFKNAVKGIA